MKLRGKQKSYILVLVAIILASLNFIKAPQVQDEDGKLRVSFIDVGQGDCSLISIDGKTLLIDCGEEECWEEDIKPFMQENHIRNFTAVMASHYHSDHAGGVLELVKSGKTEKLIIPETEDSGFLKNNLLSAADINNVEVLSVGAGDNIDDLGMDIKLEVLFPDGSLYMNEDENINNDSIVLRLDYHGTSFLFTGDLEAKAEMALINSEKLDVDVLKVAHHGSKTSSTAKFLKAVSPRYAVIEVGENNSYGHPHGGVVKRIQNSGAMIYRTDRHGDITFIVNENGIEKIETQR